MDIYKLLIGKKALVMTDLKVEIELEIKEVKENHHSQDIGPSTKENDWWPPSVDWTTYTVYFTNGGSNTYSTLKDLKLKEDE